VRALARRTRLRHDVLCVSLLLLCNTQCCTWFCCLRRTLCMRTSAFTCARLWCARPRVCRTRVSLFYTCRTLRTCLHTPHTYFYRHHTLVVKSVCFLSLPRLLLLPAPLRFRCRTVLTFAKLFLYPYTFSDVMFDYFQK
jgi:hypothetical protein